MTKPTKVRPKLELRRGWEIDKELRIPVPTDLKKKEEFLAKKQYEEDVKNIRDIGRPVIPAKLAKKRNRTHITIRTT